MRIRMVHCKMLPMGIYGAEVTPMSDTALRTFRGAIFSALRSRCDMGANAGLLFAELATRGWEVDPELRVAHNRIAALTRPGIVTPASEQTSITSGGCFTRPGIPPPVAKVAATPSQLPRRDGQRERAGVRASSPKVPWACSSSRHGPTRSLSSGRTTDPAFASTERCPSRSARAHGTLSERVPWRRCSGPGELESRRPKLSGVVWTVGIAT